MNEIEPAYEDDVDKIKRDIVDFAADFEDPIFFCLYMKYKDSTQVHDLCWDHNLMPLAIQDGVVPYIAGISGQEYVTLLTLQIETTHPTVTMSIDEILLHLPTSGYYTTPTEIFSQALFNYGIMEPHLYE